MSKTLRHLPGDLGLPILGSTIRAMTDPIGLAREKYAKYGTVYKAKSVYMTSVSMLGPDAAQYVLQNKDGLFSSEMGWSPNLGLLFPNSLMLQDFDEHKAHRQIMLDAFKRPAIERYAEIMSHFYRLEVEEWANKNQIFVYQKIKKLFLTIGVNLFFGHDLGTETDWVNQTMSTMTSASTAFVRRPIIGLGLWKGIAARKNLALFIEKYIPKARAADGSSILSKLCAAKDETGNYFTDQQIVDHMLFIIMAAHDTTTSAATSMLIELAKHPSWQIKVRDEIKAQNPANLLDGLNSLLELDKVFKECLRLYPPVPALPRYTLKEVQFSGQVIPANTYVWIFPYFNHRCADYWTNPDAFDPDRFSSGRAEDRKHKFLFVPFGGGVHTCIGLHLGGVMVKLFVKNIVENFVISVDSNESIPFKMFPFPRPAKPFPMDIERV